MTGTVSTPRRGIYGVWDRLVGPDTTTYESGLILGSGLGFSVCVVGYAFFADLGWNLLQLALVAILAFDIAGGVPGNTTRASTKWYHRPSQRTRDHFAFIAIHIVHLFVLAALFPTVAWLEAGIVYMYLLVATSVVLMVPETLQQPVATTMFAGGILLSLYGPSLGAVFAWVAPFLYLKLVLGHAVGPILTEQVEY